MTLGNPNVAKLGYPLKWSVKHFSIEYFIRHSLEPTIKRVLSKIFA